MPALLYHMSASRPEIGDAGLRASEDVGVEHHVTGEAVEAGAGRIDGDEIGPFPDFDGARVAAERLRAAE
jgi:hypothetical protein